MSKKEKSEERRKAEGSRRSDDRCRRKGNDEEVWLEVNIDRRSGITDRRNVKDRRSGSE